MWHDYSTGHANGKWGEGRHTTTDEEQRMTMPSTCFHALAMFSGLDARKTVRCSSSISQRAHVTVAQTIVVGLDARRTIRCSSSAVIRWCLPDNLW
jgi:hypothetical protein